MAAAAARAIDDKLPIESLSGTRSSYSYNVLGAARKMWAPENYEQRLVPLYP